MVWMALAVALGAGGPGAQPAFTLEQAAALRTPGQFELSPDGRHAAYVLSGHFMGFPVVPRFGADNNVRMVALDSGRTTWLTSGVAPKSSPVFSPDGGLVAYESQGDIHVARIADGRTWPLTTNAARDWSASWAPGGAELVFVSDRGGRVDLWVASVDGERHGLRQLTADARSEADPQVSPDGARVAFSAPERERHYYARGIWLVAWEGGESERVTPADESDNNTPRWAPDGETLAILSDRSGHFQLWTVAGSAPYRARHYDTGPHDSHSPYFEVEPVWARDGSRILVARNRDGRYELVSVTLESGDVSVVAGGPGLHTAVGWTAEGALVYGHENAWTPPGLFVEAGPGGARRVAGAEHAAIREESTATVSRARFSSADGLPLHGFVLRPRSAGAGGSSPGVVVMHPNSHGQFHDRFDPFLHHLAESGFVLLLLDQRGSSGYGRSYRETALGEWGQATVDDVVAAAAYLGGRPGVDPDRLGALGLSFGAYQVLLALTRHPEVFRAGVAIAGVSDRRPPFANHNSVVHVGDSYESDPQLFERVSPIAGMSALEVPLLLMHGDADANVPLEHTLRLQDELQRLGKRHEVVVYPGEAHGLAQPSHREDCFGRIESFFERHLAAPWGAGPSGRRGRGGR